MQDRTPSARCLDLSRLLSRVGRGAWTGVDRVEIAYLDHLLADSIPLFALVRTGLGFVLLDQPGAKAFADRLHGRMAWGAPDLLSGMLLRASPAQRAAESDLRRLCVGRCRPAGLGRLLRRHLPSESTYLNVGHSNLNPRIFTAVKQVQNATSAVLIHDLIPLDFPDWQRAGTVESFAAKMSAVSRYADLIIYNSCQSQRDGERHFSGMGRVPDSIVAHLGMVDLDQSGALPDQIDPDRPYFVAVGTIEPRKNHELLLDLWQRLTDSLPSTQMPNLYIIGSRGWENERVFARLDAKPPYVHELPGLSDAQMIAAVRDARALLFPSHAEGFGLPPCEAAALGVPVVANDLPVYHEFLSDYPIYADARNMALWERTVVNLIDSSEPRKRQSAPKLPSWDEHFKQVLSVL